MNDEQLQSAINHLIEKEGLVLPYNAFPGSRPGGIVSNIAETEAHWATYTWNPPQFISHLSDFSVTDTDASNKPTYASLMSASKKDELTDLRRYTLNLLKSEVRRRIILAYGADSFEDEVMRRLRGDKTPDQDIKRDRLRTTYNLLKATALTANAKALKALDILSDATWGN